VDRRDLPIDLTGKRVLDIGCWTGGVALLLAAMGAEVTALEEVKKYADCTRYISGFFECDICVWGISLYDFIAEYMHTFDYVLFSGVLYHISDPIVAMRATFNWLEDGGKCLIETAYAAGNKNYLEYHGPTRSSGEMGQRIGWNWFIPSIGALKQMCCDVGFEEVSTWWISRTDHGRAFAVCEKKEHKDMLRSGLSRVDLL
jgi:SAM-dependent methyltransferase